jgi:hypothetical protein
MAFVIWHDKELGDALLGGGCCKVIGGKHPHVRQYKHPVKNGTGRWAAEWKLLMLSLKKEDNGRSSP